MNLFHKSLSVDPDSALVRWGHFILRVSAGLMIFYIHGWHKLEGWIAYLRHGTPWKLAEEVAGMHLPAPLVAAGVGGPLSVFFFFFFVLWVFPPINSAAL